MVHMGAGERLLLVLVRLLLRWTGRTIFREALVEETRSRGEGGGGIIRTMFR